MAQSWDVYVSKSGFKSIVDFVTDDRVITTVWNGTLKQPERLAFTAKDFQEGIDKQRVAEGNCFKIKASNIMRDLWDRDRRNIKYIEGFGSEDKPLAEARPWDILRNGDWEARLLHAIIKLWERERYCVSDTTDFPHRLLDIDGRAVTPEYYRTPSELNNYVVAWWLISKKSIARKYEIDIERIEVIDDITV